MPTLPQVMQSALAAYQRGDLLEAERLCRTVLGARKDHFDALHLMGVIAARSRRIPEAADLLSRAVSSSPNDAAARSHLGNVFRALARPADALASYERALALAPDYAEAHYGRGNALIDLERPAEALESYDRALALLPDIAEAHNNRGMALVALNRHAEALASYARALALKPGYAEAHHNRGAALGGLGRHAEALEALERAVALKPDLAEAHNHRGLALVALNRHAEALASYERALALKPDYAEAHNNRGIALFELARYTDAIDAYGRALARDPDYASAHWNRALCQLLVGDLAAGWRGYEWRLKLGADTDPGRNLAQPSWRGEEPLAGKAILLQCEQGLGDTLHFCRYARDVAALGASVLLQVQAPLVRLLAGLEGVTHVLQEGAPLPAFDCHCPLASLPLAFSTDLQNIPLGIPYLRSDAARVAAWHEELGRRTKPRVGLVWTGSAAHRNDRNRSIPLAELLALVGDWAEWISMQKDVSESDAKLLASRTDIRHVGGRLTDFADTAALVELMDVVVTVDTSVAHLAGAMGKPVWILLARVPDWRWLLEREDSVWYPTARLFRQPAPGDWTSVLRRLREGLERQFRAH